MSEKILTLKGRAFFATGSKTAKSKLAKLIITKPKVTSVEGPYDENDNPIRNAEYGKVYYYYATLNVDVNTISPLKVKWAVAYDSEKFHENPNAPYYLFGGKERKNNKIRVEIGIGESKEIQEKINEKFRIYAYLGTNPDEGIYTEVKCKYLRKQKYATLFFIGGAGDAESYYGVGPTYIMKGVKNYFDALINNDSELNNLPFEEDFYISEFLGYNEAKGDNDIKKYIIDKIPDINNTQVYIIGHSLGGWNGAHLSRILSEKGYKVGLLATLDPVGFGVDVHLLSDIYRKTPKPKANYWINVYADPKNYAFDDFIADYGGQWIPPKEDVQIYHITKKSHGQAKAMFKESLKNTSISTSDMLLHLIKEYINKP